MSTGFRIRRRPLAVVLAATLVSSLAAIYAGAPALAATDGPAVEVVQQCRMDATDGPVNDVTFNVTDPGGQIESITVTGTGLSQDVTAADGWAITLLPGLYQWSVNFSTTGHDPLSGDFEAGDECLSCPIPGAIDLSSSGVLGSYHSPFFETWGGPVVNVNIPAGLYNVTLASYDKHSEKPTQTQHLEKWALADGPNGGTWQSPFTPDLSESANFEIYTTVGGGPVAVPEIQDLYTVHGYIGQDMSANSVRPMCALFEPVTQPVDVTVTANSCDVDDQGLPTGSISVSIDPAAKATVSVYSDAAKTSLVATLNSTDELSGLSPGDYWWEATAATGYELTGDAEGMVTIEECSLVVSVVSDGICSLDGTNPYGSVAIGVDPDGGATVTVYSDSQMQDEVLNTSTGGNFDLDPGTYYWSVQVDSGFDYSGPTSGTFTIDPCPTAITAGGECLVDGGVGVGAISVEISVPGSATVQILDSDDQVVASLTESGTVSVPEGQSYSWQAGSAAGFAISGPSSGDVDIETCTPDQPQGRIIIEKTVLIGDGSQLFDFGSGSLGWDFQLSDGQSDSMNVDPGTYTVEELNLPEGWSLTGVACDDNDSVADGANGAVINVDDGETVTCDFTNTQAEVQAAIFVTVDGACLPGDDSGQGRLSVDISVDGGATVVITDDIGAVVATLTESDVITVDDAETYSWVATPSEGFEFPAGLDATGQITIGDCSEPDVLPFTGMDMDRSLAIAVVLLGAGMTLVLSTRRRGGYEEV